jgi:hypothetical protein
LGFAIRNPGQRRLPRLVTSKTNQDFFFELKANMLEEYKKLTFPSTAACKSDGRKDKVQELRKEYATT